MTSNVDAGPGRPEMTNPHRLGLVEGSTLSGLPRGRDGGSLFGQATPALEKRT